MIFFYPIFSVSASIEQKNLLVYFWSCSLSWHLFLSRPISLSPLQSLSKYFGLGSLKFYPKISSSCPKCTQYWLRFSTLYFSRCAEKEELVTLTGVVGGDLVNRESDKLPQPFDREKNWPRKNGLGKNWEKYCHDMSSEIQPIVDHSSCVFHDFIYLALSLKILHFPSYGMTV